VEDAENVKLVAAADDPVEGDRRTKPDTAHVEICQY
jgi:hypothetical protein